MAARQGGKELSRPARRPRQSQAERSAETRARLLDAAERALIDVGYYGTSTPEVCRRAGVSHGSLLHHYGTREALLAAVLERLYQRRQAQVLETLAAVGRSRDRIRALVDHMWAFFEHEEWKAVVELWLAVANEPGLRCRVLPVMQAFDATLRPTAARLFLRAARRPAALGAGIGVLFNYMQGMGLARVAFGPPSRSGAAAERRLLARMLAEALDPS